MHGCIMEVGWEQGQERTGTHKRGDNRLGLLHPGTSGISICARVSLWQRKGYGWGWGFGGEGRGGMGFEGGASEPGTVSR